MLSSQLPSLRTCRDALLEAKYPWCFRKQGNKCGFQSRIAGLAGHIPGKIFQRCDAGECVWSVSEYVDIDFFFPSNIPDIPFSPSFSFGSLILLVCLMLYTGLLVSFPISPTLYPCLWQPPVCSLYLRLKKKKKDFTYKRSYSVCLCLNSFT